MLAAPAAQGLRYARRMWRLAVSAVITCGALQGACVEMGWVFGPGFSVRDPSLFAEPPVVERRGSRYVLTWTQGSTPFFFEPASNVMDGRLVFALGATASSGNLAGRPREMPIEGAERADAIRRGGAFWWDPEPKPRGAFVPLRVVDAPANPHVR